MPDTESATTVDRLDVIETCTRLAWLADRRDWDALVEVFADEVDLDYTSLTGGAPARLRGRDIVDSWRGALGGLDATQHLVSNHLVTVHGDAAECTAAFQATHVLPTATGGPLWTLGGHYDYRLARTHRGWVVAGLTMSVDWATGNQQIMTIAASR